MGERNAGTGGKLRGWFIGGARLLMAVLMGGTNMVTRPRNGPRSGKDEEMNRTVERVVEVLQRAGPGALSEPRLASELLRCRPQIRLTSELLDLMLEESEGRLARLEVAADDAGETVLDSWIVLMDPDDGPPRPWLATMLWRSLAAMAEEVNPESRTDVARWIVHAERAERLLIMASRFGLSDPELRYGPQVGQGG